MKNLYKFANSNTFATLFVGSFLSLIVCVNIEKPSVLSLILLSLPMAMTIMLMMLLSAASFFILYTKKQKIEDFSKKNEKFTVKELARELGISPHQSYHLAGHILKLKSVYVGSDKKEYYHKYSLPHGVSVVKTLFFVKK